MQDNRQDRSKPLVTGSFPDRASAERAYDSLTKRGYSREDVHVMMSNDVHKKWFPKDEPKSDLGNKALEGAGVGAGVGGAVGATLLAILAAGTALTLPGIGLVVAGPIAGALAGAGAGGAAGTLIGALVGAGIPEDRAKTYESDLKEGRMVLGVNPRSDDDAEYFEREWGTHGQHVYR